jgi:predicted dehydrogenase
MITQYKAALIGCGKMGTSTFDHLIDVFPKGWLPLSHGATMNANAAIDLVALCDSFTDNLNKASEQFKGAELFTSVEECLASDKIDIVSIATRTPPRPNIIRQAIKANVKAMHFEKPICQNLGEAKELIAELNSAGIKYSYGTLRRYMAAYRTAKSMIDNGDIGTVKRVVVENDVTTLMWNHPHAADMLIYFSGSHTPINVQANCTGQEPIPSPDETVIKEDLTLHNATVIFDNGVHGHILSAPGMNTRIYGDKGTITVGSDGGYIAHNPMRNDFYIDAPQTIDFDVNESAMEYTFQNLIDQLNGKATPLITGAEIIGSHEILCGCAYSTQRGGVIISVSDIPDSYRLIGKSGDFYA